MLNFDILKEAAEIDDNSVIKVAGITNRLINWFKKLTSKEYAAQVHQLRTESEAVKAVWPQLALHVNNLQRAIDEADVEDYEKELQEVKHLSDNLNKELEKLNLLTLVLERTEPNKPELQENSSTISIPQQQQQEEEIIEKTQQPRVSGMVRKPFSSLSFLNELPIFFSEKSKTKFINELDKFITDPIDAQSIKINQSAFFEFLEQSIKNGEVLSIYPMKNENRVEQNHVEVITSPFSVPGINLKFKANVLLNELPGKALTFVRIKRLNGDKFSIAARKDELIKLARFQSVVNVQGLEQKSPEFVNRLIDIGNNLNIDPSYLASVMSVESGINSSAKNPMGGATGLIQFMPSVSYHLGTNPEELASMSDVQQLDYVEKFFKPFAGKIHSAGDLYMATFLPEFVGKPDDMVIAEKGNNNFLSPGLTYDKIYKYNSSFDRDKDGKITISDVKRRAEGAYARGVKAGTVSTQQYSNDSFGEFDPAEIEDLSSFLTKSNNIYDLVKKAILKENLPDSKVIINIFGEKEINNIKYAKTVCEALKLVDINSFVGREGNDLVIVANGFGQQETLKNVIKSICSLGSDIMEEKYNVKISSFVEDYKKKEINKLGASELEVEISPITFSSVMRDLNKMDDKKELLNFLKSFKNNFDQLYIAGNVNCEEEALSETL